MSAAQFSTRLGAWCAKYPNQHIAADELGVSYGTLTGWLGGRLPCALRRAAVIRRIKDGTLEPVPPAVSTVELAARSRMWRGQHGLSQIRAAVLLGIPRETFRRVESMSRETDGMAADEILRRMGEPVSAEALEEVTRRTPPVEPAELAKRLRQWRRRYRMSRERAAEALRAMGFFTTGRTIWVWETERMLPRQPLALMAKLDEEPPKPPRKPKPDKSFGRQLRAWRRGRGLTQREALAVLGVPGDQAKLSDWERGKKVPKNVPELIAKMETAR
jgi:transcriptional regulator with XRE-family HTH domain